MIKRLHVLLIIFFNHEPAINIWLSKQWPLFSEQQLAGGQVITFYLAERHAVPLIILLILLHAGVERLCLPTPLLEKAPCFAFDWIL